MQNMPGGMPPSSRRTPGGRYVQGKKPGVQAQHMQMRQRQPMPHSGMQPRRQDRSTEHIRPMNPSYSRARIAESKNKSVQRQMPAKKKYRASRSKLSDFAFGFAIGLVIFGIAAIIICNALIGLLT